MDFRGTKLGLVVVDGGKSRPQKLYERYRHRKFKCGEDDDGYAVKMKLKYFLRYMATQHDDSPMYVRCPASRNCGVLIVSGTSLTAISTKITALRHC